MHPRTIGRLLLAVSLLLSLPLAAVRTAQRPVKSLPAHLAESGIPTEGEIALVDGWLKALAAGQQSGPAAQAWFDRWIGTALPFSFRYDGKDFTGTSDAWQFHLSDVRRQGNVETQDWSWLHAKTGLKATWHVKRFLDYPAVDTLLTFEDAGNKDTGLIEQVQNLDLKVNHSQAGKSYTIHGAHGGRCGADDFMPFTRKVAVAPGVERFGWGGFSSNEQLPFFNIETPENRGVLMGLGWTGTWRADFTASGSQLEVKAAMPGTHFRLRPGEQVRGPRMLLVFWNGQCLHGHNMLRHVIYEHYLPRLPDGKPHQPLVSVNTCFTYHGNGGYLEKVNEQTLSALVKPFIDLGVEAYVIDAGYYTCKGWQDLYGTHDWSLSKERFPHGLAPIRNPLAAAGIYFGLWFPAEWLGYMGDAKGRETFLAVVDDYVKNQGINMYRQDQSNNIIPMGPDRLGLPEMQYITGMYEMQDQIRIRHPGMLMEGCCGGGRRVDLETLARFHWHQKSDSWFHSITDQAGMYGGNLYMPGGVLNLPTQATDNFGVWSSFGGQLCVAWHPLDKDFPMDLAKRQVKLYKRVRPYLSGDFYPLTDCTLDRPWLAYQFHRHNLGQGFALIFKRKAVGQPGASAPGLAGDTFAFAPRGLDPQARYAISCQASGLQAVYTGAQLAKGVTLTLKKTPGAELVIYQQQP